MKHHSFSFLPLLASICLATAVDAQVTDLGPGCGPFPATLPTPALTLVATPAIGTSPSAEISWSHSAGYGFLAISANQVSAPIPFGQAGVLEASSCFLYIDPTTANLIPVSTVFGFANIEIPIPDSIALIGQTFTMQAWTQRSFEPSQSNDPARFHGRLTNGILVQVTP